MYNYSLSRMRNNPRFSFCTNQLRISLNNYTNVSLSSASFSTSTTTSTSSSSSSPSSIPSSTISSSKTNGSNNNTTTTATATATATKANPTKVPIVPWGLTPRYAQRLPVNAYVSLPEFTPLGILNRPSWYEDACNNNTKTATNEKDATLASVIPTSIGPQAEARAFMDALNTPRDEYIVEMMTKITFDGKQNQTSSTKRNEKRTSMDKSGSGTEKDEKDKIIPSGGRRTGRRRSNLSSVTNIFSWTSSGDSTTPNKNSSTTETSSTEEKGTSVPSSENDASSSSSPSSFKIRSPTPEELDTLLLGIPFSRSSDSSLPPLDKSIRTFIDNSMEIFTLLFSSGLPYIHREYNKDIDSLMFHPTILQRLNDIRTQQSKAATTNTSVPPSLTTSSSFNRTVTIKSVKAARIIDTWSVWDSTVSSNDDDNDHRHSTVIPVNAIVREIGHSATIEVPTDNDTTQNGFRGILIHLLNKFFHYYQLKPVTQVQSQITVAYLCVEEQNQVLIGDPLQDHGGDTESIITLATPTAIPVATSGTTIPKYTIHTVTYEAHTKADEETSITILKYLLPQTLTLVNGWRIVDIDGHFGPNKIGYPELSFDQLIPRARSMSWRRAGLELRDAVSYIHDWCGTFQHVSETGEIFRKDLQKLRSVLDRTPAGKEIMDRNIHELDDHSLRKVMSPLVGMLIHLEEASSDIADIQHNRPPWVKRTGVEIAYDKGLLRVNDNITTTDGNEKDGEKITTDPFDELDDSIISFLSPERPASTYKINQEIIKLNAAASPILGSIPKNDNAYEYAQYGMQGKAIKDVVSRTTNSQQWIIAAYQAVRARIGSSMGELHSRRLDSDIMYQVTCRAILLIVPVVLRLTSKYLPRVSVVSDKKEKEKKPDESPKETVSADSSNGNESEINNNNIDRAQLRKDLEEKILLIKASVVTVKNLRSGGPTGSLFSSTDDDDSNANDGDDDESDDDDEDNDNRKNRKKDRTTVSDDPKESVAKLTIAEKEARKLDPTRSDRTIFRNAVHTLYTDVIELLEIMEKHGLLNKELTKEEIDTLEKETNEEDDTNDKKENNNQSEEKKRKNSPSRSSKQKKQIK